MPEIPESIGPYRILAKIGEGGMGVVYKAQDQRLQRVVALKVIREFDSDSTRRQRFWQEARTAAQVAHPNACRIYDIVEDQQRPVLVMESSKVNRSPSASGWVRFPRRKRRRLSSRFFRRLKRFTSRASFIAM